jgi:hypothetical protein
VISPASWSAFVDFANRTEPRQRMRYWLDKYRVLALMNGASVPAYVGRRLLRRLSVSLGRFRLTSKERSIASSDSRQLSSEYLTALPPGNLLLLWGMQYLTASYAKWLSQSE